MLTGSSPKWRGWQLFLFLQGCSHRGALEKLCAPTNMGGGGELGTDYDHDTLEFTPWSMVKKLTMKPSILPMVNGQN